MNEIIESLNILIVLIILYCIGILPILLKHDTTEKKQNRRDKKE